MAMLCSTQVRISQLWGAIWGCKKAFLCHEVHLEGLLMDGAPGGEGWWGGMGHSVLCWGAVRGSTCFYHLTCC